MIFHAPPLLQYLNHCFPLPALYPHFHLFKTCISLSEFFPICSPISQVKNIDLPSFTIYYTQILLKNQTKKRSPKPSFFIFPKTFHFCFYTARQKVLPYGCASRILQSGNFPLCGYVHIVILSVSFFDA